MTVFFIILIILLTLSLSVTFAYIDSWAIETEKKIRVEGMAFVELVKELKENLKETNKALRFIYSVQKSGFLEMIFKFIDLMGIVTIFAPKTRGTLIKKLFSIRFLTKAYSLIRG